MIESIQLKVQQGLPSDIGHGRARLPFNNELGITPGDYIEIEGERKTVATVWRIRPEDKDKGDVIRIDRIIRKNAQTEVDSLVSVRKVTPKKAKKIVISPALDEHKVEFGTGIEAFVLRGLLKRPVSKGDKIFIPGMTLFSKALPFLVESTVPEGIVMIGPETQVLVKDQGSTDEPDEPNLIMEVSRMKDTMKDMIKKLDLIQSELFKLEVARSAATEEE